MQDFYQPYFQALKKIFNGTPVKELDDIRVECNNSFLAAIPSPNPPQELHPVDITLSYFADAENKILMGNAVSVEYALLRKKGRKILKNAIELHAI